LKILLGKKLTSSSLPSYHPHLFNPAGSTQNHRRVHSRRRDRTQRRQHAALSPLGTDWHKPFLEEVPYLIVIFGLSNTILPDGSKRKNYYVTESVGIATGMLITAIHNAGLASLTHPARRLS
jgi:hypothetical protein